MKIKTSISFRTIGQRKPRKKYIYLWGVELPRRFLKIIPIPRGCDRMQFPCEISVKVLKVKRRKNYAKLRRLNLAIRAENLEYFGKRPKGV